MNLMTKQDINRYLDEQRGVWSAATLRSEAARLATLAPALDGNPKRLWEFLHQMKPYSRVTYWVRATQIWAFLHPYEPNPYAEYRKKLKRQFSVAYTPRVPQVGTLAEVRSRLQDITDPIIRAKCLELLETGMRWAESHTLKNGEIVGKGGKLRKIFNREAGSFGASAWRVRRELRKFGLTPHALRKIFGQELVRRGANPYQLMKLMGWSNLNTAQSYIEANNAELEKLAKF